MKKFTKIYEKFEEDLLRNKLNNKSELFVHIKCDFCSFQDEYRCENNVVDKEEMWLAVETFVQNGWDELITPEKNGIACPNCIEKWKEGNWYIKESKDGEDFEENFEEYDFNLKYVKKTIFHVDYNDFNKLVNDFYKPPLGYEFVADVESANDSTHEFRVRKNDLDEWDKQDIERFRNDGKYQWLAGRLLNDLCDKGIIDPGEYYIRVSW